jgi:hypothetical protein
VNVNIMALGLVRKRNPAWSSPSRLAADHKRGAADIQRVNQLMELATVALVGKACLRVGI